MRRPLLLFLVVFVFVDFFLLLLLLQPNLLSALRAWFRPKPGSCLVLEEKYCHKGHLVYYNGKVAGVGFSLPAKAPIFSPFDGPIQAAKVTFRKNGKPFSYPAISIAGGVHGYHIWDVDHYLTAVMAKMDTLLPAEAKKGQIVGHVSKEKLGFYPEYNLVVYFSAPDKEGFMAVDRGYTRHLFGL